MDRTADVVREKIFDFAYQMAMRDATLQKAYYDEEKINDKKHLLDCKKAKRIVKEYIDCILTGNNTPDFFIKEKEVEDAFSEDLGNDYPDFTFGNTQKLINMTAKYMFISCYNEPSLFERFAKCHCPMDSKMVEIVIKQVDTPEAERYVLDISKRYIQSDSEKKTWRAYLRKPWSNISAEDHNQYLFFQEIVSYLGRKCGFTPLEFDYFYWE